MAHNVLLEESWNFSFWSLPESTSDILTVVMIAAVLFMIVRRMVVPFVKVVTTPIDYVLLIAAGLPFITGFIAYHQWFDYKSMLIIHILSGELMLVLIPFTKLAHMILFFLSRAHIGMEFGERRGTVTW
jgi:nitrate reductase gamma subunit